MGACGASDPGSNPGRPTSFFPVLHGFSYSHQPQMDENAHHEEEGDVNHNVEKMNEGEVIDVEKRGKAAGEVAVVAFFLRKNP